MIALTQKFEKHLKLNLKKSAQTVRNYKADLKHFIAWLQAHSQSPVSSQTETFLFHFNSKNIFLYRSTQVESGAPTATTNRRLSAVRNFGRFLASSGIISLNPAEAVENIRLSDKSLKEIIQDFEQYLLSSNVSRITIKNYLSDIRQFANWLEKNVPSNQVVLTGQAAQQPFSSRGGLAEHNSPKSGRWIVEEE